jgi:hypothetical protein
MLKNRATRKEAYSSATIEGVHKSASSKNASPNSRILSCGNDEFGDGRNHQMSWPRGALLSPCHRPCSHATNPPRRSAMLLPGHTARSSPYKSAYRDARAKRVVADDWRTARRRPLNLPACPLHRCVAAPCMTSGCTCHGAGIRTSSPPPPLLTMSSSAATRVKTRRSRRLSTSRQNICRLDKITVCSPAPSPTTPPAPH